MDTEMQVLIWVLEQTLNSLYFITGITVGLSWILMKRIFRRRFLIELRAILDKKLYDRGNIEQSSLHFYWASIRKFLPRKQKSRQDDNSLPDIDDIICRSYSPSDSENWSRRDE